MSKSNIRLNKSEWIVREKGNLEISLSTDKELFVGDKIEFQLPNSWSLESGPSFTRKFQIDNPTDNHFIEVLAKRMDNSFDISIKKRHLNNPEGLARHGRHVIAELTSDSIPANTKIIIKISNTYAPDVAEQESIWLKLKGEILSPPELRVLPKKKVMTKVIVPSVARPGESIDILIVSLDEFNNISSSNFKNAVLLNENGEVFKADLNFTGSTRVQASFEEEGVYRFIFDGVLSNALKISKTARKVYWGDIHIHSKLSHDAEGSDPYGYARNASGLDFAALTDHWESLGENGYSILKEWTEKAHKDGKFVVLPADERNPPGLTGHHNVYFRDMDTFWKNRELARDYERLDTEKQAMDLKKLDPAKVMLIPHHTGIGWGGNLRDASKRKGMVWDRWEESTLLRPLVEIYSHHGQSELYCPQHALAYETNRMRNPERRGNLSTHGPYYAQDFWKAGKKVGVICSSDVHSGQGGKAHGGIAAVSCGKLTRESVFDTLLNRQSYGSTGERILIELSIAGAQMGEVKSLTKGDIVPISLSVYASKTILRVEILRYRFGLDKDFKPFLSALPQPESMDAHYEIEDEFIGPCVYYARVTQEPINWLDMAWTSPVWLEEIKK
jgi:hypothetical protein